ncbi:MAG: tetratricopeptide repeat protein [Spirochaetaceae bacterium]|jgi:tetratricopeptide (TPR) repeat protein|nr:tetratricopeptide repeat protein [Spirochaetaceae bacterium]
MNAQEYLKRGVESFNRDDFDQAIADFSGAIRLDSNLDLAKKNLYSAYFNRGVKRYTNGDNDGSIADFTEAVRLKPDDAEAYRARGTVNNGKGDYDRAIADFTELIRLDPNVVAYLLRQANYYEKCKAYRAAGDKHNFFKYIDLSIADLKAALQIDPNNEMARKMLSHLTNEREARAKTYEAISWLKGQGL